jgi:hypothetical protein
MKIDKSKAEAKRLSSLLTAQHILIMPRDDWDGLSVNSTALVKVNLENTPLAKILKKVDKLAAVARNSSVSSYARLSVYRNDEKDWPTTVNADHYEVCLDMSNHPKIGDMIVSASTSHDANLGRFFDENVFLEREPRGDDHWLRELPDPVKAVIKL